MFEGFSQEALDFLNDIRFNNHQQFYEANRTRYEQFVKAPLRALSDELALSRRRTRRRIPHVLGIRRGLARLGMRQLLHG